MTAILDTNVLVALSNEADSLNGSARNAIKQLQDEKVLLPAVVVAESLIYEKNAIEQLHVIREQWPDIVATTEEELVIIAEFPLEFRKKLKANDCLILAHCIVYDARLLTFDDTLEQAYREACLR